MKKVSFKDKSLSVTVSKKRQSLWLDFHDLKADFHWQSPLLTMEIHDRPLKREEKISRYEIVSLEPIENGVEILIRHSQYSLDLGMELSLDKGELSIILSPSQVYERDPEMYRLFAIDILPDLMNVGNDGEILLPINTGMVFKPGNKPKVSDRFLIYGEQERWELTPSLPICAVKNSRTGLIAMATQGACDAQCRVATDGSGNGKTGFAVTFRRLWPDPVDYSLREIRLCRLPKSSSLLKGCAQRLRRHIREDLGKKTLLERAKESPEVKYLLNAYIMKLFFGVENCGYMMEKAELANPGSLQNYMTFAEARAGLKKLHAAGVEHILTQCTGWNTRGHDGLYPTRFPVEERFGGEAGFRDLIATGNQLGYHIQVHDNFIMNCKKSPDFNPDYVIVDRHGEPLVHGRWAGGIECSGWPLAMPEERISGHMEKMKDLGLRGMYYVDYMEQPLEVNYHPCFKGGRADCARGQQLILEEGRRVFGSCGTEFGFLPCTIIADHMSTCGDVSHLARWKEEWPICALKDEIVPLWQMALSGLIVVEARRGVTWHNIINCILYGHAPRDEWSVRPGIMPVLNNERVKHHKIVYDLCVKQFGHLKTLEITDYQTPDKNIQITTFEDGTNVFADFNKEQLIVNDKQIDRPKGLKLKK